MSPADVDRLYDAVDKLRHSVEGYRADLNGRLRALEQAEAQRQGSEDHQDRAASMTRGTILMLIAGISCATGVATAIFTHVI